MNIRITLLAVTVFAIGCGSDEPAMSGAIRTSPSCEGCTVELAPTVLLASEVGPGSARYPARVVRLSDGSWVAGPTFEPGTVARYSADGVFETSIGEYGEGPGEMEEVHEPVTWVGDSLAVLHDVNTLTVFDRAGAAARSIRLDSRSFLTHDVLPTSAGTFLARRTGTGGGEDVPLREYSAVGEPIRTFGTAAPLGRGRTYAAIATEGSTVYALGMWRYEIDVFAEDSDPETIVRSLEWFPPDGPRNDWGGRPTVSDAVVRRPGELMVLVQRPRADFELPRRRSPSGPAEAAARRTDHRDRMERYEQFIEVIDVDDGEVVASSRVEGEWVGGFVDGDHVFTYFLDLDSGRAGVQLWRVTVTGEPE